jgi:energy-coupling factor transporter ATP-binding protein EcfA2
MNQSEIRDSQIRELLTKVRKRNYGFYLRSIFLTNIRQFSGASITFDFPVTAIVGPNGSGKSTVLAAAACAYPAGNPKDFFFMSLVGDEQDFRWELEYELIDKKLSVQDALRSRVTITREQVERTLNSERPVQYLGIHRTVPPVNSPLFMRKHLGGKGNSVRSQTEVDIEFVRSEASKVIGKDLASFRLLDVMFTRIRRKKLKRKHVKREPFWSEILRNEYDLPEMGTIILDEPPSLPPPPESNVFIGDQSSNVIDPSEISPARYVVPYIETTITSNQLLFVADGHEKYSEFNFGSGEASVLRLVYQIERLPEQTLVLIEEIENGLHPLAVERLVEYLISVAIRRKLQVIFTTHSDYAVNPLPPEGVWATLGGRAIQGKLSVESLRALSGRVDKRLAIFAEDLFAEKWLQAILREGLGQRFDEVGVYHSGGDGEAVHVHLAHNQNPSINFKSLCFIDGDSRQHEDHSKGIFRLPGENPELAVFNSIKATLAKNAAVLTAACQRPLSCQQLVVEAVNEVANTNRDPHLLFGQIGMQIGLVSEEVVRGAFFSIWIQENASEVTRISEYVRNKL